jgi:dTDP-4-amino-4,6-dideoxygalactose transaminase
MSELEAAVDVVQLRKMEATVRRFRAVKRRVLSRLKTYREIVPQKLNDPDGEVGYLLRFYPQTARLGAKIVEALRAEGIESGTRGTSAGPDWHQYSYMYPVTQRKGPTDSNCPFECPVYRKRGGRARYARGDCPMADDLFDRMVTIGLNQWLTARDRRNIADGINKVLGAYCTEDASAQPWL